MRIRSKHQNTPSKILIDRTNHSIKYALLKLKESKLSPFIKEVYLYGSAARKEQKYNSDVDLFVELEDIDLNDWRSETIELKSRVSPISLDLPEVDLHITVGDNWKNDKSVYHQNIRREGIKLWDKQGTLI